MKKITIILVFSLFVFNLFSINNCLVSGIEKDYSGKELLLKTYTDEIIFGEKTLGKSTVDSLGHFSFEFETDSIITCFIEIGAYHGIFYVEPGKKYTIDLPSFTPITTAQHFNPYFKPEKIFLKIKTVDKKDINRTIVSFEDYFSYYYIKCALSPSVDTIKAYISKIEQQFPDTTTIFFRDYKKYKFAMMANLNEKYAPDWAISSYISKTPVSYNGMAFWETFNTVFDDFFNSFEGKMEQEYIDKAFKEQDYIALCAILQYRFGIENKTLQELVVIKGLYDSYFSSRRSAQYILSLMNHWRNQITVPQNIAILNKIIEKLDETAVSYKAFNFNLADENGKYHQLSDYKGKYVYLNFCNTSISLSKKDFGILAKYSEAYKKDLVIINVFTDDDKKAMISFLKSMKLQTVNLLATNNSEIINKYQVVNIPSYYLIDRKGNFLISPAPTPDENFEQTFENILSKDKLKEKAEEDKDRWW